MSSLLYLDTARLGRMSPSAQRAHRDFVRFAGEEGCPLYFEEFLRQGFAAHQRWFNPKYPGLRTWPGVPGLKQSLRRLINTSPDLPVLFANRSAQLMKFAARLLFMPCDNVLVTDLAWPAYRAVLDLERNLTLKQLTEVKVRDAIVRDKATEDTLKSLICTDFRNNGCDGLFLPEVSHDGIRFPVDRIVAELANVADVRFVVVDGAQAFRHTTIDLRHEQFDLYLAGSHKWLGAYYPLGLAFYGKRRSRDFIETIRDDMLHRGDLDDPLLRFTEQLDTDQLDGSTETVNLTSLFSCAGAVHDASEVRGEVASDYRVQLQNRQLVAEATDSLEWRPAQPVGAFRSGILILQSNRNSVRSAPAQTIREAFQRHRIAVTAYENGVIRLSMPQQPLVSTHLSRIRSALRKVS